MKYLQQQKYPMEYNKKSYRVNLRKLFQQFAWTLIKTQEKLTQL